MTQKRATQGVGTATRFGIMTKDKRREQFGLECVDQLEWRKWEPGTEYVKSLTLKNVSTTAVTVSYKQTASKAFNMEFPEPVKIRPGMSTSLKVQFQPRKVQQYSDHIEIFVNDSSFIVLIEAYLPAVHIEVPSLLDFGFVPTKELVKLMLPVKNTGDLAVEVTWKLEAPFTIEPSSSRMGAGEVTVFMVTFTPPEACSYNVDAICQLDSGTSALVQISGIGKFPYLSIEHPSIDFGNVLVGRSLERTLRFGNHSVVNANFTVVHTDGPEDGVFSVTPTKGMLGPDEYTTMRVAFKPRHTGTFSSETFLISTAGGNKLSLNLMGAAMGPNVTFSARSFNFGNVPCSSAPSRVLYIQNHSEVPVSYDFQLDPHDTFAISKPRGIITPQTTSHVTVTLKTSVPALYWKRVACLIKDADPIGLDLLASCYDDKSRPPPFNPRHISNYIHRIANGGAPVEQDPGTVSVPPSPILNHYGSRPGSGNLPGGDPSSYLLGASGAPTGVATLEPLAETALLLDGPDSWELLFGGQDPGRAVSMDTDCLDFGTCSKLSPSDYKSVVVTNNTSAKVTAFFSIPHWVDPLSGEAKAVFQIFPEAADLKPHSQSTFRIAFRPPRDAQHYAQTLQLCAFVKSMRSFRLVGSDNSVVPPWTLPMLVAGNTFLHTNPEFAPKVELTHSRISFPPCRPGDRVCQTTMIVNYGDTPCAFNFQTGLTPLFEVRPSQGVIPPKAHILIGFRFSPIDARPASTRSRCLLNGVAATALEVVLQGAAHMPRLTFDVSGPLFFRPTCVGASSHRLLSVHNPSRVPVGFAWKLPRKLKGVVGISPLTGVLRGNESMQVTWTFAPREQKTYDSRVPCVLLNPGQPVTNSRESTPSLGDIRTSSSNVRSMVLDPALVEEALGQADDADVGDDGESVIDITTHAAAPAPKEKVLLHLVGEGTGGAMALDPPNLELGTVRVGHTVCRTVNLINQSDGVLRYSLECLPDADSDGVPEPGATPVEFSNNTVDAVAIRPGVEMWVDESEGALPARASKQVTITFMPRFRKDYRMQLLCRTATVAPIAAPVPGASASGSLLRPLSGTTPSGAATRLPPLGQRTPLGSAAAPLTPLNPAGSGGGAMQEDDSIVKVSPLTTICPLRAKATFPAVLITDSYIERLPKQVVWDMVGARTVNAELASNVADSELELSKLGDKGTLTTETTMSRLRANVFNFGMHGLGDQSVVLMLELSNATELPVKWELDSSDNPDLELENWVEPGQPRNAEEKERDFIVEHRIIDAKPRRGQLDPNGRCTITFVYSPHFLGSHDLPMFLHMTDGKRIRIQLQGVTVQPPVQQLRLLPAYRHFTFDPVAIGELQPPLQTYLLRNGGPGEVTYTLDLAPLVQVAACSLNYDVIQLKSEVSGTIPAGGTAPLNWLFSPVEAIHYAVDIPIHLGNGTVEVITLQGRGFHPDSPALPAASEGEGERDWARWTGFGENPKTGLSSRLAVVSHDMLSMGTLLFKGVSRRVLVLTNRSVFPLCFNWDMGQFQPRFSPSNAIQAGLSISPSNGTIHPGEQVVVRFVMEAGYTPQLFESEVACQVSIDEEEMFAEAEAAVKAAEAESDGAVDYTDTGSVIEEVIVESPNKYKPRGGREARLRNRLPIHLYMTTAIRTRISALNEQYMNTLEKMTQRTMALSKPPELPSPEVVMVTLSGRVLAENHIKAGYFIPPHELEQSKEALAGACWVPPVADHFWSGAAEALRVRREVEAALALAEKAAEEEREGALQAEREEVMWQARAAEEEAERQAEVAAHAEGGEAGVSSQGGEEDEEGGTGAGEEAAGGVVSYTVVVADGDEQGDEGDAGDGEAVLDISFAGGQGSALPSAAAEHGSQHAMPDLSTASAAASSSSPVPSAEADEEASRSAGGSTPPMEYQINSSWKPLPRPPIIRPPSPPQHTTEQSVAAAVTAVLRELLCGVIDPERDPSVLGSLDTLAPEKLAAFAQLCSERPQQYSMAQQPLVAESPTEEAEEEAAEQEVAVVEEMTEEEKLKPVFLDKTFQVFAEFVLESAILGLVQESAAGDWEDAVEAETVQPEALHSMAQDY